MRNSLDRRQFLKLSALALGGLAFTPAFPRQPEWDQGKLARVATKQVDIRSKPSDDAPIVGNRFRDQLIRIYGEVNPEDAPKYYNTLWYRVWGGYVHSARLQQVEVNLQEPTNYVPEFGWLAEVTVPFTTAYQLQRSGGWTPWRGSRLYYSSTHWLTGVENGPDGRIWYQITNELSSTEIYYAPAEHFRIIKPDEYAPTALNVPAQDKRIEVSLTEQMIRAFEKDELVYSARISSGIPDKRLPEDELPTATPEGRFRIYSKMPSKHMGSVAGGEEVEERGGFTLPGVPWTLFFRMPGGYALHGTYWHNNFGLQMSHGCVNMRNQDALWLFRWTTPVFDPSKIEDHSDWEQTGNGTLVIVSK
ncbi:MAG TPA: L,D-transpeptidase [Anaerolineales bacterium]|nr:L,D-transpeptidase [Anaerolineales bacterium]